METGSLAEFIGPPSVSLAWLPGENLSRTLHDNTLVGHFVSEEFKIFVL